MPTKHQNGVATVEVVHFADPWCWWSWGLEPIIRRLKEVYGDQIKVTYRIAGFGHHIPEWRQDYDVVEDQALLAWINHSVSLTKMPIDPQYILKTGVESTWASCTAVKAAQLQSEELGNRFFRRMMETIQVEAKNGSEEEVYLRVAEEVGLDVTQLRKDAKSRKTMELFEEDMKAMNVSFLTLVIVNRRNRRSKAVGEVFTSHPYEEAVEELSGGTLRKKTPTDILEYLERHRQDIVPAKEIAEVFGTSEQDAARRLDILAKGDFLGRRTFGFGTVFWTAADSHAMADKMTIEQVNAAHVSSSVKITSETGMHEVITDAVKGLYTEVAVNPDKTYHFPLGRKATLFVGYPRKEIDQIPETAIESFAGVGYPHVSNAIKAGDTVLDVGSGSGTDVLVASLRTGSKGKVIGLDFTDAMIEKARSNIAKMGAKNVKIVKGDATKIPLEDKSVDVVTSNGVLNLVPEKKKAFREIYRVLKPGGRIQIADIVVEKDVQKACGLIPQLWADCIGGAAVEDDYLKLIRESGFKDSRIVNRLDYFAESPSDNTKRLTRTFGAQTIVVTATKPA